MNSIRIIYVFVFVVSLFSCQEEEEIKGSIVGFVQLVNDEGKTLDNVDSIKVSLEATNRFTLTDENGRFEIDRVKVGTYNLLLSKSGFGTLNSDAHQITPGPNAVFIRHPLYLYALPSYRFSEVAYDLGESSLQVSIETTALSAYYLHIFLSSEAEVSPEDYDYKIPFSYCCYSTAVERVELTIDLEAYGIPNDETLYAVIYGYNSSEPVNEDMTTGLFYYNSYLALTEITAIQPQ